MHKAFQILPADINASQTNLFGELSHRRLSFFFQNAGSKMITGLSVFNLDNTEGDYNISSTLEKIFDDDKLLKEPFNKIFMSYSFSESILTPGLYYNRYQNNENLNLMYGDLHQGIVLTDHIAEKNLYNTYRIPADVHAQLIGLFSEATFIHQYSLLIKQLPQALTVLKVLFYQNKIIIILQKEDKLQLIQAFYYAVAEDVLYHMLNVCSQFNIKDVPVQLCGMIERDSALFREIEKYFMAITLPGLPAELSYAEEIKDLPGHFFNNLFSFALCV